MTEPTTTARTPEAVSDAVECAIGLNVDCGGPAGVHRVRDAVLAALQPELDALAALRAVARGYCPTCGRGDAAPTVEDWEQQRDRAERAEAERDHLAAAANPADVAVRAIQLMQETGRERDAFSTGLREARTTNQRLNRRTQELESELAAYRRAVAEWQINEQNAYIPLRTIAAIAKATGLDIPTDRFEMHYQRLERAEAAVARVREYVATSDDDGIRTRQNILSIVGDWRGPETAPAAATQATDGWTRQDDGTWTLPIDGGTVIFTRRSTAEERAQFAAEWKRRHGTSRLSARLAWTGAAKEALLEAEQQQWADAAGLSRADEDEAADVYEEMLRRVESSGPRPAPAATEDPRTVAVHSCGKEPHTWDCVTTFVPAPGVATTGFVPYIPNHIPKTGNPADALVVEPYRNDRGQPAWVFRCWGTDTCDGWLSLDHYSQQSAERARDRHVAEEHQEQPNA